MSHNKLLLAVPVDLDVMGEALLTSITCDV